MPKFSLVVRTLLASLLLFVPLPGFDQWLYDNLLRLQPPHQASSELVIVRLSEGTVSQDSSSRPGWNPQFYSALLERLASANPKVILLTNYYDQVSGFSDLIPNGPILLSSLIDDEGRLVPPVKQLTLENNYGFNNLFPDSDNVVRSARLVFSSGKSLALKAREYLTLPPTSKDLVPPMNIFYHGPAGTFESVEAWQIVEGTISKERFKNKILLVGQEGSPSRDFETPFGRMSRLEIHANILQTFLEDKAIFFSPPIFHKLLACFSVLVTVLLVLLLPLSWSWITLVLYASLLVASAYFGLILFKMWISPASSLFCIFGTHLLLIGFKIGRQEEKQWRIQEESRYLREMDQFKDNFVSLFSHDLKTPIAKIKAIIDRIKTSNQDLSAGIIEGLEGIERANGELSRLISDILRVTKMESMPIAPAKEVVDINRLVESAIQRLKLFFDEKHISLVRNLEPLFSMEGDPQLLQEVITNLLENAVKYSPPHSRVIIETKEDKGKVQVRVLDQGPGIPEEELPRVTSKFYRGKRVDKSTRGSGLGLYLAKYFVELHRGELKIQSREGEGTEVSFSLPIS